MEEQDVELRDYIKIILKRKKMILTIFFGAVIITTIISFVRPRTYEAIATIENGFISESVENGFIRGAVIRKEDSKDIITSAEILEEVIKEAKIDTSIYEIKGKIKIEDLKGTSFFKVKVQTSTPEEAKRICEILANIYLAKGHELYWKRESLIKEDLEKTNSQIDKVEKDIANMEKGIIQLLSSQEDISPEAMSKIILLQNILSGYRIHLADLKKKENDLKTVLVMSNDFRIIDLPLEPQYPIKPKIKFNIAISGILSLMFGIFLAFFVEYVQQSSPSERKQERPSEL